MVTGVGYCGCGGCWYAFWMIAVYFRLPWKIRSPIVPTPTLHSPLIIWHVLLVTFVLIVQTLHTASMKSRHRFRCYCCIHLVCHRSIAASLHISRHPSPTSPTSYTAPTSPTSPTSLQISNVFTLLVDICTFVPYVPYYSGAGCIIALSFVLHKRILNIRSLSLGFKVTIISCR